MRFVTFDHAGSERWGLLEGDQILVAPEHREYPRDVLGLVQGGLAVARRLADRLRGEAERLPLAAVTLRAPLRPPRNVICLGLNFVEHARESLEAKGQTVELPEHPVVFTKATTSVNGPYADVPLDPAVTGQLDWEAEMAFVICRGGRNIAEADALTHVFGYLVLNDLSARDLQFRHKQFFLGKSVDGCCPMGPALVGADEIPDPQALDVRCWVNGVLKQDGNTRQQLFGVARTIHLLSQGMTLLPGDIISTGTPEGVGFARKPPQFLRPGDVVECEVSRIGRIRNRIVAAEPG